jgi:hypothetical protein
LAEDRQEGRLTPSDTTCRRRIAAVAGRLQACMTGIRPRPPISQISIKNQYLVRRFPAWHNSCSMECKLLGGAHE